MGHRVLCSSVIAVGVLAVGLSAQETKPQFEVASVKRNVSGEPGRGGKTATITRRGDAFVATNVTLESLVRYAYYPLFDAQIPAERIVGGPAWVRQSRFDIEAGAGRPVTTAEVYPLVQRLLETRFSLIAEKGSIEREVFRLVRARSDGRLGPEMIPRANPSECRLADSALGILARSLQAGPAGDKPALPPVDTSTLQPVKVAPAPPGANRLVSCGTLPQLAGGLSRILRATVSDQTGLTGRWDYTLTYSGMQPTVDRPDVPMIFTALEEQLGLKLERGRGPVDVLVIDSVQQPTDN